MVARGGLEPPTQGFSVPVSKNPQKLYPLRDRIFIERALFF